MFIETWVAVLFVCLIFFIVFLSIAGWAHEGVKNDKLREEIGKLRYEKKELMRVIERKNKEAVIREANAFSEESE